MRWEREQPCVNDDGRCVERAGSMGATRTSPQPSHSSGTNAYVSRAVRLTAVVCLITICKAELLAVPKSHPHLPSRPPILACLWPTDVSVLLNVTHHLSKLDGPPHSSLQAHCRGLPRNILPKAWSFEFLPLLNCKCSQNVNDGCNEVESAQRPPTSEERPIPSMIAFLQVGYTHPRTSSSV